METSRERNRSPRRPPPPLPWGQWWNQLRAIVRLELRKGFFRRPIGLVLLASLPLLILLLPLVFPHSSTTRATSPNATQDFALLYQSVHPADS